MGFVEDPTTDLPLSDGIGKRAVPKLFRGDIQQGNIPKTNFSKDITPFRRSEESVEGSGKGGFGPSHEAIYLVLHQGLQGRDDNCENPTAEIADEGGKLEAERLAAAGGQNGEEGVVPHAGP